MSQQYTELNNRKLWFDGSVSVDPSNLMSLLLKGKFKNNLYTTEISEEINAYNRLVGSDEKITIKTDNNKLDISWNIPDEYKQINIKHHLINKLRDEMHRFEMSDNELKHRIIRIDQEMQTYIKLNLYELLQTLVYMIDVFNKESVVWGVGRGSSVSSYVLYLIGVHDIDSVLYDLNFNDFLTGE